MSVDIFNQIAGFVWFYLNRTLKWNNNHIIYSFTNSHDACIPEIHYTCVICHCRVSEKKKWTGHISEIPLCRVTGGSYGCWTHRETVNPYTLLMDGNGWKDGWLDGRMDGQTNGRAHRNQARLIVTPSFCCDTLNTNISFAGCMKGGDISNRSG